MKLLCECGQTIVDQADNLSYNAYVISDKLYGEAFDAVTDKILDLIKAIEAGEGKEWITKYYDYGDTGSLITRESVLHDLRFSERFNFERCSYQCEECGRVYIESADKKQLRAFCPEKHDDKRVFDAQQQTEYQL